MSADDLQPLQIQLTAVGESLKLDDTPRSWIQVEQLSTAIADGLRGSEGEVDNHAQLGKGPLPQTLTNLITLALHGLPIPSDEYAGPVLQLLRISANLCLYHGDSNRGYLLDAGLPQVIVALLEGYADRIPPPTAATPLSMSIPHLLIVKTSIGVLLNVSMNFDAVKFRLISLESALTILKLSSSIYPPMSWHEIGTPAKPLTDEVRDEWALRTTISAWAWRTVSDLRDAKDDAKDDARQILNVDVLPWVVPALSRFVPPYHFALSESLVGDFDLLSSLIKSDFEVLEETCSLLESLSLDVEDIRLALARGYCFPAEHLDVPCFQTMVEFVEKGSYPPTWQYLSPDERARKEKTFNMYKAALIKSVVEVAGEEKNEDVLWDDSNEAKPGGNFVDTMSRWIKTYIADMDRDGTQDHRDDLVICATLALGNLARREKSSSALLSQPLALAPYLTSTHILSPSTDVKLKHGALALLKHVAQSAALSPVVPESLAECHAVQRIAESGIWDEGSDNMAIVVQLNAIGVVKHLCNASVAHALAMVESSGSGKSPLQRIMGLVSRSDSVPIKSEGVRALVNVVRTLLLKKGPLAGVPSPELTKQKETAIQNVLTQSNVNTLAWFLARSGKFPLLVNEAVVALRLLSTQKGGGILVLDALLTPTPESILVDPTSPSDSAASSPTLVNKPRPAARHGLEMLANVLRNTDNPAVYPVEVRANVCTFVFLLWNNSAAPQQKLSQLRDTIKPMLEMVKESPSFDKEEVLATSVNRVLDSWKTV